MGTKVYSSWIADGKKAYQRLWFDYTISKNDATTYTLTLSAGAEAKITQKLDSTEAYQFQYPANYATIFGTGQTSRKSTAASILFDWGASPSTKSVTFIKSFTWSWTKTHSAVSKTVTLSAFNKASKAFSVAAKSHYSVTYNANGGSGAPGSQTKWHGETLTLSSTKPTRSGYTFSGWNTNSSGTGTNYASGGSYTGNTNLPLYAKWTPNKVTIICNANGGTQGSGYESQYKLPYTHTWNYNSSINLLNHSTAKLTKTGYHVEGTQAWNTSASGTGTNYNQDTSYSWTTFGSTTLSSKTINLYAKWVANTYSVKYNANGGTGTMSNSSHTYNVAKALTQNAFTRNDYTFSGWATSSTGGVSYANGASVKNLTATDGGTVNLYAVWNYNYQAANISNLSVVRVDGNGDDDDTGGYARYVIDIVPAQTKNQPTNTYIPTNIYIDYKEHSGTTWYTANENNPIEVIIPSSVNGYIIDDEDAYIPFSADNQYDIRVRAEGIDDNVVKITSNRSTFISKAEFSVDISANGKCIGIFTTASDASGFENNVIVNGGLYYTGMNGSNNSNYAVKINNVSGGDPTTVYSVGWNGDIRSAGNIRCGASRKSVEGTKTVNAAQYYDLCSLTLNKGYAWLVLSHTKSNSGSNFQIINRLRYVQNSTTYERATRVTTGGGQGLMNYMIVNLLDYSSDVTITLSCYGYNTTSHTETGHIDAIPIMY